MAPPAFSTTTVPSVDSYTSRTARRAPLSTSANLKPHHTKPAHIGRPRRENPSDALGDPYRTNIWDIEHVYANPHAYDPYSIR